MKPLNPKSKLSQSLASSSAALKREDLPKHPTDAFTLASRDFEETLYHLFNPYDVKSHGFCKYDQRWYAEVNAPTLFNHKLLHMRWWEEPSAMRYAVTHYKKGKAITNVFATLKQAKLCAERIFMVTGIIVGIEEISKGKGNA